MKRLSYIESVIAESMRLSPPAYASARDVVREQQMQDFIIRDNSLMVISPHVTHRRPDFWVEPERVNPERFFHGNNSEPFAFFPYGGGMRTSLGLNLARVVILTVVAMLLHSFRWTIPDHFKPKIETHMTLRAKKGISIKLSDIL